MRAIDFSKMGFAARGIEREWKKTLREHNAYKVKNMYHKKKDMDGWNKKQQEINNHYRTQLKDLEKEANKKHMELEKAQYQRLGNIMNFDLRHHKGLSRAQVEVVAGKVSALNECFY